jgi:hypothetical protein
VALAIANIRMWPDSTVSSVRRKPFGNLPQRRGGTMAKKQPAEATAEKVRDVIARCVPRHD